MHKIETDSQFQQFYKEEILPELITLDNLRREQLQRVRFMIGAALASGVFALISLLPYLIYIFLLVSLLFYFLFFGFRRRRLDYKSEYKRIIISKVMQFIDPGSVVTPHQYISQSKYHSSKLFLTETDIYSGENHVQGIINGADAEFSELHTQNRTTDHRGPVKFETIFNGFFFLAGLKPSLGSEIFILSNSASQEDAVLRNTLVKTDTIRLENIQLNNPEFDKLFTVLTTNGLEARSILAASFIVRILNFQKQSNPAVQIAIIQSHIYIAIPWQVRLFAPTLWKPLIHFKDAEEYYKQVLFCRDIVEEVMRK
jgi:hypothetical protein